MYHNANPKPEPKAKKTPKPLKRTALKKKAYAIKRSPIKYRRKPTGELEVFKSIWAERPHYSQVSGEWLGDDLNVSFFSHILPKSHYKRFRLNKQNIVLKTEKEHHLWETQAWKLKDLPEWKWVFDLKQSLKEQYNNGDIFE